MAILRPILRPLLGSILSPLLTQPASAITYLLGLFRFATDEAAPLASPHIETGAVGSLTLVQNDGQFSASEGWLVYPAQATPVVGDLEARGTAQARIAGLGYFIELVRGQTDQVYPHIGWNTTNVATSTNRSEVGVWPDTGGTLLISGLTYSVALGVPYEYGVVYQIAVILRGTGGFVLIRDGAFTTWELLWVVNDGAGANPVPFFTNRTGTGKLRNAGVTQLAGGWATSYGIATDRKATSVDADTATMTADAIVEHTITAATGVTQELMLRRTDDNNCCIIRMDQAGSTIKVIDKVAGVETQKSSTAQTWTNGTQYRVVVRIKGATVTPFVANVVKTAGTLVGNLSATGVKVSHAGADLVTWPLYPTLAAPAMGALSSPTGSGAVAGVWTWFNDPRALAFGSGRLAIGYVNAAGDVGVADYGTASDTVASNVTLRAALEIDDHDNPALLRRASDGRLMAWYSAHNGPNMYQRISTNADDASAWGTETNLDSQLGLATYSYTNPYQLTGEANSPIYLFHRGDPGSGWAQYFTKSTDGGATWAAPNRWLQNGTNRPYLKLAQNGTNRIDFCASDGNPNDIVGGNSVYHGYYQGGNLYKSDGTLVGALASGPYTPSQFTKVYDGATVYGWVEQIAIDPLTGYPVLVYSTFPNPYTDHRYRYARWTGSAWDDHQICTAGAGLVAINGNHWYSGGVCLDPADTSIVYASRDTGDGIHQIWQATTADGGTTWALTKLTSGTVRAFRPFVAGGRVLYVNGRYATYNDYDTHIAVLTP